VAVRGPEHPLAVALRATDAIVEDHDLRAWLPGLHQNRPVGLKPKSGEATENGMAAASER